MNVATFATLGYFEKLKAVGVPDEQARVQVETLQAVLQNYDAASRKELATKGDVQDARNALTADLQANIQNLRNELAATKHEILKWMRGLIVAQTALILAVVAFMK